MKVAYFTLTGQTKKFVNKLPYDNIEIKPENPFVELSEEFILVVPSYEVDVTDVLWDFMDVNKELCKGVCGGGNRNFAELFGFTAKDIASDYDVPLLMLFEFQGSKNDVKKFEEVVCKIENTKA